MILPVDELVVTEGSPPSEDSGAHAPRLVPAEETDDGPRQVPDFADLVGSQLRAQRRNFAGFPLNRPRRTLRLVGGTLVDALARAAIAGLSN